MYFLYSPWPKNYLSEGFFYLLCLFIIFKWLGFYFNFYLLIENMVCAISLFWNLKEFYSSVFNHPFDPVKVKRDKFRFSAEFRRSSRLREGADAVRYHSRSFISMFVIFFAMLVWPPRVGWGVPPCFAWQRHLCAKNNLWLRTRLAQDN